jgi:hypothetical protein
METIMQLYRLLGLGLVLNLSLGSTALSKQEEPTKETSTLTTKILGTTNVILGAIVLSGTFFMNNQSKKISSLIKESNDLKAQVMSLTNEKHKEEVNKVPVSKKQVPAGTSTDFNLIVTKVSPNGIVTTSNDPVDQMVELLKDPVKAKNIEEMIKQGKTTEQLVNLAQFRAIGNRTSGIRTSLNQPK